mgnify:CR=1 FL=1|tara:strand:- start:386 stop:1084 length:699 start_codon:yes stop_codon:yes gene_type:complete
MNINNKIKLFRKIKRFEDVLFSLIILFFFFPILFILFFISLFIQGWPVFYVSNRMVSKDTSLKIIKFRTMVKDATSKKYSLEHKYMKDGYLDIPLNSEVFTPLGKFLEKTQIVELPQIFPILFGKLSFVGNRPLPSSNIDKLRKKFPKNWDGRFIAPAGLTGISQVVGKFEINSRQRLELECLYSKVYINGNILKADTYIFFSTIILLLVQNSAGYRSFDRAKKMLLSCIYK